MSLLEIATDLFLEQFLLHPTIAEVNAKYRDHEEESKNHRNEPYYDTWKLAREYFIPLAQEYLSRLFGDPIPADAAQQIVRFAKSYATQGFGHCVCYHEPNAAVQMVRLKALLLQPAFLVDPCGLSVMVALKDLQFCEPWTFEMWSEYSLSDNCYHIKSGFGTRHVPAFHRFILCDELWTGKSRELRRVFFASVAQALRLLSTERNLLLETLQPRMDLLARNVEYGKCHEVWCCGSFYSNEMDVLINLAKTDRQIASFVETIESSGMRMHPHCC